MKHRNWTMFGALLLSLLLTLFASIADGGQTGSFCEPDTHCDGDGLIVDVAWLRTALDLEEEDVQVVDVRSPDAFAAGHVPGSLHVDEAALRTTRDGVAGQIATPEVIESALQAAGLRAGARVVVLGDEVSPPPARVVWALHYHGHTEAHLLQGGWTAWVDAGAEIETGPAAAPLGDFAVDAMNERLRVDAQWVLDHLDDPTVALVDARSPEEYAAGHIPGAINIDWHENVSGGALLGYEQLEELYDAVLPRQTVVAYCASGMRSSLTWLVLRALGHADVRLYDGSWNEWGSLDDLPKAQ